MAYTVTMLPRHRKARHPPSSLAFLFLSAFLLVLWAVGGASRADVLGQAISRAAAALALLAAVLFLDRPSQEGPRAVLVLLAATIALVLLQLIPLPPAIWQAIPGRDVLAQAMQVGEAQPWRPLSIEPGATVNAAGSLLVPAAVLLIIWYVQPRETERTLTLIFTFIGASAIVGLVQLSGTPFSNPTVNDTAGAVSGLFANRNHFALLLALGCLIAPVWAALKPQQAAWRTPFAFGLLLLFFLIILASGSRSGLMAGTLGSVIGIAMTRGAIKDTFRWIPRRARLAALLAVIIIIALLIATSIASDRAQSISRAILLRTDDDMRSRAFATVIEMIGTYMPFGSGFGSFDTIFRMHEPFRLLKPTYFNHAHNDFLEIALDGGVPAILLTLAALGWWLAASIRVWRDDRLRERTIARLGSAMLLLVIVASVSDYPARTPFMMAIITLAATWLNIGSRPRDRAPLPA